MPTFALNFSRPGLAGRRAVLQLRAARVRGLRGGAAGGARHGDAPLLRARSAARVPLITRGDELPVFAFTTADDVTAFDVYDVSRRLRERGWQVPAYSFPKNREDLNVLRVVVRNGNVDLLEMLIDDIDRLLPELRKPVRPARRLPEADLPPLRRLLQTRWEARLFAVGSACFALGAVPGYASLVGAMADNVTYAIGSVFFTTASFVQLRLTGRWQPGGWRSAGWSDWWAAAIQFVGHAALQPQHASAPSSTRDADKVWRPDAFGSHRVPRRERAGLPRREHPRPPLGPDLADLAGRRGSTSPARSPSASRRSAPTRRRAPTRSPTRRSRTSGRSSARSASWPARC